MKEAFEVRIKPNWDIPTGAEIDDDNGLISKDDDWGYYHFDDGWG